MYCRDDVHFIVIYLLALRDAFSKVLLSKDSCIQPEDGYCQEPKHVVVP